MAPTKDGPTLVQRLEHARGDRSLRWILGQLNARRTAPLSYSTLHGYFSGKRQPKVGFLEDVADLLGVPRAWLVLGEGTHTLLDVEPPQDQDLESSRYKRALYEAVPELTSESFELTGAFMALMLRIVQHHTREKDRTPEFIARIAKELWSTLEAPGRFFGWGHPREYLSRWDYSNYAIASIQALALSLPRGPQDLSIEPREDAPQGSAPSGRKHRKRARR